MKISDIKCFNNCAAWAKGWYKRRDNIKSWWMDLAHCIHADGWCGIYSKKEVVNWILHQFDTNYNWWKDGCNTEFGFAGFNQFKLKSETIYRGLNLDEDDLVILYYKSLLSNKTIIKGFRPSEYVLPLYYAPAYYYDGTSKGFGITYTPADMKCDVLYRIEKIFPADKFLEQKFDSAAERNMFQNIESFLVEKNWNDVVLPLNYEDKASIILEVSGKSLKNYHVDVSFTYKGEQYDYVNLGIYEHSIGFSDESTYKLYVECFEEIYYFDDDQPFIQRTFFIRKIELIK